MTEKVRFPERVCQSLDGLIPEYRNLFNDDFELIRYIHANKGTQGFVFNGINTNSIIKALVLGYEPELTAEEQIKQLYDVYNDNANYDNGFRHGVRTALQIHGIHYDWLGDAE